MPRRGNGSGPGRITAPGPDRVPLRTSASGGDRLGVGTDLNLARLGLLQDGDVHGKHAAGVAGLDLVGVDRVRETEPPGAGAHPPLAGERLPPPGVLLRPPRARPEAPAVPRGVHSLRVQSLELDTQP